MEILLVRAFVRRSAALLTRQRSRRSWPGRSPFEVLLVANAWHPVEHAFSEVLHHLPAFDDFACDP